MKTSSSDPTTYPPLAPGFAVSDAAKAIDFYTAAFGAKERMRLIDPKSGKIGHAELMIGDALIMISDEYPEHNKTPEKLGGTTVRLCLMSDRIDADYARAIKAGAEVVRAPSDQFYGHRTGCLRDPFGHEWTISQETEKVSADEMQRRWNEMASAKA